MTNKIRQDKPFMVISYALSLLLLVIVLTPFITAIIATFKVTDDLYGNTFTWLPSEWNWQNYPAAWTYNNFGQFIVNSVICAVCVTILGTIISSMAAFGFARIRFFGRDIIFYLVILTQGIPFAVLFIPTYIMMNRMGLVNTYAGLILPLISFPMGTFLMRQSMLSIPVDYEYASKIDGCNRFQMFWKVFLPMVSNTLIALGVFSFMMSWNNYLWPLVVVNKRELYTIPLGLTLYNNNFSVGSRPEWNTILSAAIMSVLPILVFYSFASAKFMDGITLGGLKA